MMDDEDGIFAVRRSTQDKLTYKNSIAQAISKCNSTKGTTRFKDNVQALASTIMFDVSGYSLASKLQEIKRSMYEKETQFIQQKIDKHGKKIYYHANQAKLKIQVNEWYWNTYYESILQLLASHNLLFDTEKKIPVIKDNKKYDDEEYL